MVDDQLLELLVDKRELAGIKRSFAEQILDDWLCEHEHVREAYHQDPERFTRKKEFQKMRSAVRKRLREVYGVFFGPQYASKREAYIQRLIETDDEQARQDVLSLHRSTKERQLEYPFLYQQLFDALEDEPSSILDLGCGFNPFSYAYLPNTPAYHCADIACADLQLIDEYLQSLDVEHSTHCIDLTDVEAARALPRCDVAFAFKLFDSLETLSWDVTEQLIEAIPARTIIASFPTKSIGQGKEIGPRKWFNELITGKSVTSVTLPNEQFFIITDKRGEDVTHTRQ